MKRAHKTQCNSNAAHAIINRKTRTPICACHGSTNLSHTLLGDHTGLCVQTLAVAHGQGLSYLKVQNETRVHDWNKLCEPDLYLGAWQSEFLTPTACLDI